MKNKKRSKLGKQKRPKLKQKNDKIKQIRKIAQEKSLRF